ncbi:MAG: flagellar biosynthesis protein FlgC [Phyllobacteriaceae bacterium]|nr:flagellar biosynthesis protein FlgC [Phyllobacteriaceae bacterium]
MSMMSALAISLSGMNAAARRLETSASNVANVDTVGALPTASRQSTVYRAEAVVQTDVSGGGVATSVVRTSPDWTPRFQPSSTFADTSGLVAAPSVDLASEAATQISAKLAYQASAKATKVEEEMAKSTIDAFA